MSTSPPSEAASRAAERIFELCVRPSDQYKISLYDKIARIIDAESASSDLFAILDHRNFLDGSPATATNTPRPHALEYHSTQFNTPHPRPVMARRTMEGEGEA